VNEPGKLGLAILAGAVIVTGSLVSGQSAHGSSPAPRLNSVAAWQSAVGGVSSPGRGCFRASYPNLQWHATTCTTVAQPACAPATQTRRVKPATPNTVGNGYDYSAQVAGTIFQATGSFTNVSSTISEKGKVDGSGPQKANTFSLQLNTQTFSDPPACSGSADPSSCSGWQQFIYSTNSNQVFMQYWLLDYANTCPSGWVTYRSDCYTNSPSATNADSAVTAKGLASIKLEGSAFSGGNDDNDNVILIDGTTATVASNADSMLDLSKYWNTTEWGVFGDAGGGKANFASGSSLTAKTTLGASSASAPRCVVEGFTGETNNLNLAKSKTLGMQSSPTMTSKQTVAAASSKSCGKSSGAGLAGYSIIEAHRSVSAGSSEYSATAECPSGDLVVGGGGYQSLQTTQQSINSSWPSGYSSWIVTFNNTGSSDDTGTAIAYCVAASSVGDYSQVSNDVSVPPNSQVQSVATCPSGTVSLGGGWSNDEDVTGYGAAASTPYGTGAWRAILVAGSGTGAGGAVVICASPPAGWVQMFSPYVTNPASTATTVSTNCPSGTEVLGGGSFMKSTSSLVMIGLTDSLPSLTGWQTNENNNSSSSESVDAWAICANV
jgi:hypothetical protein